MEVRFCITTTPRSGSGLLNPPAASSANSCKGVRAWHPPTSGGNDERGKSPKPRTGIALFLGKRKPRASHIPTARLLLLLSLHRPSKAQNQNGITRYLPDLPTDSSEEAGRKETSKRPK